MNRLSKEQIKERLIKRAADSWGVDEMEIEHSFDPIISILFDACANEFEKINDNIQTSRSRITERLVDILTPETIVTAKPAHAIMHALPVDDSLEINHNTKFYHRKRYPLYAENRNKQFKDLFFSPAGNFNLSSCQLVNLVFPDKIFDYKDNKNSAWEPKKEPLFIKNNHSTIYLGIKVLNDIKEINDLSFFFDALNPEHKELILHYINIAVWSLNGKPVNIKKGFKDDSLQKHHFKEYVNESIQNKLNFYEEHVRDFYRDSFFFLSEVINIKENSVKYPEEFREFLSNEALDKFTEPVLWFKINFSTAVHNQLIESLHCHINCFPIINKMQVQTSKRVQEYLNIIPLETGDNYFLDVHKVVGDANEEFFYNERDHLSEKQSNIYLRFGGVSRFDERNASELLNHILDLIKSDTVAFKAIGSDFINANIKDLNQIVARIEQKIEHQGFVKKKIPYLIINNSFAKSKKSKIFFTTYWTTAGEEANKINPFVKLQQYQGTAFHNYSIRLITTTKGGTDEPSPSDKIYAYREHNLSKGKIVTKQDIIHVCKNHYKSKIENIRIDKGVMVLYGEGAGYTPTTDIYITKNNESSYSDQDWEFLKNDLLITLKNRSSNVIPFRIFYQEPVTT